MYHITALDNLTLPQRRRGDAERRGYVQKALMRILISSMRRDLPAALVGEETCLLLS